MLEIGVYFESWIFENSFSARQISAKERVVTSKEGENNPNNKNNYKRLSSRLTTGENN